MPSIDTNRANWNDPRSWQQDGEEWSAAWGGTASMWFGSLLPRLAPFLPVRHLLEIACGHGRVTAHLLAHCDRYTGVDLAPDCVATCQRRFAARAGAMFLATDGKSLSGIADASIDLACSWDSLVHAEADALVGYMHELARVLRPGGFAWLHHSNLGAWLAADGAPTVPNPHWRARTVSAASVRTWAATAGLQCVAQEIVQWGGAVDNDCFSLLRGRAPGDPTYEPRLRRHPDFNAEIEHFRQLAQLYRATPARSVAE